MLRILKKLFKATHPDEDKQKLLQALFPNVTFGQSVQIIGLKNVAIGEGACVCDQAWLTSCVRDEKVRMNIGKNVLVGRNSMITTAGKLEIGDYCVLAPRVYISDADHIYTDINQPILQQGVTSDRTLIIEENCWFGINTVISGNLTIGRGSVVAANAVVTRDVPPFSVVAGNPAKVIKMYNPVTRSWERTETSDQINSIVEARLKFGLPERDELRKILEKVSSHFFIDPVVTGGKCI